MTLIAFLLFTGAVGLITFFFTRRDDHNSSTGYFLAGRSLTWIVISGSLLLTNLSTEQLVGLNGGGYNHGMQVMAWEVWSSIAIVLMALVFLPRYLKGGVRTVSEFLADRYSPAVGILVSLLLLFSLLTNLLPFVLYSGAIFMRDAFNIPSLFGGDRTAALHATIVALGVIGSLYAIFGGLKAVAISDTLNGVGLLVGGLAIPFLGLILLGERLGDGASISAGLSYLASNQPERLNPVALDESANIPFSTLFTGMLIITTYYWCTNQAIVQRTFGARSLAEGQKGVLFAAFMKLLGPLYLVLPGIIAWHLFQGQLESGDQAYGALVNEIFGSGPEGKGSFALGLFAAVIFGAILSSFNSGLNSATTLFSVDLYRNHFRRASSDASMVRAGKVFGSILAVFSIAAAIGISTYLRIAAEQGKDTGLFDMMKNLAALYNVPLLAIFLVGFFSRRTPAVAAIVAIIFGFAFYAFFGLYLENSLFGLKMHWLHLAGLNFVLLLAIMAAITMIRPLPQPYSQRYTGDVDISPWPLARPIGIGILVLIATMYLALSRFG